MFLADHAMVVVTRRVVPVLEDIGIELAGANVPEVDELALQELLVRLCQHGNAHSLDGEAIPF